MSVDPVPPQNRAAAPAAADRPVVSFPNWARVVLSLLLGLVGYLVAGRVLNEGLSALLSSLVMLVSAAGIVPPSTDLVARLSPAVSLLLTVLVTVIAYIVNVDLLGDLGPTTEGIITAVLAFAASLGIRPPQGIIRGV